MGSDKSWNNLPPATEECRMKRRAASLIRPNRLIGFSISGPREVNIADAILGRRFLTLFFSFSSSFSRSSLFLFRNGGGTRVGKVERERWWKRHRRKEREKDIEKKIERGKNMQEKAAVLHGFPFLFFFSPSVDRADFPIIEKRGRLSFNHENAPLQPQS